MNIDEPAVKTAGTIRMIRMRTCLTIMVMIATVGASSAVLACPTAPPAFLKRKLSISVVEQPLPVAIQIITQQAQTTAKLDPSLKFPIKNVSLSGRLDAVLNELARAYNLAWWVEGDKLRIADKRNRVTRNVDFPNKNALIEEAKELCLPVEALEFSAALRGSRVRISGPRSVVSEVVDLANTLRPRYETVEVTRYGRTVLEKVRK